MARVRIIAFDPGSKKIGIAVLDGDDEAFADPSVVMHKSINLGTGSKLQRLGRLAKEARQAIFSVNPHPNTFFAVEGGYTGKWGGSVNALAESRGVILGTIFCVGSPTVMEFAPAEVKRRFTGSGSADKAKMIRMAKVIFGIDATEDEADAIGVAYCALVHLREQNLKKRDF